MPSSACGPAGATHFPGAGLPPGPSARRPPSPSLRIGQIEGHLLHPLVMSRAVRLHPLVVAISVVWSVHSALRAARLPAQSPDER